MLAVFTGPSLDADRVRAMLPQAVVNPPACRGDLDEAIGQGATGILLIDGGFGHRLAVPPSEVVRALRAGVEVTGAASMGAIRAAECHPAGMRGIGAIQRLYRLRVLRDDDEVAVATEPERGFRASSVALVNVRFAVIEALRRGLLDPRAARAVLTVAKHTHFSERLWEPLVEVVSGADRAPLRALCRQTDVKRRDAERAVAQVAREPAPQRGPGARPPNPPDGRETCFGRPVSEARIALMHWLTASGRYLQYWSETPRLTADAWRDLAQRGDLEHELMRWYAVERGVQLAGTAPLASQCDRARAQVASAHGFADWDALEAAGAGGRLPSGVPVAAAQEAVRRLTRARAALRSESEPVPDRQLHSGFRGFRHLHALQPTQWGTGAGAHDPA